MSWLRRHRRAATIATLATIAAPAVAQESAGYPERVLGWVVEEGETCWSVAQALYGGREFAPLLLRYNQLDCTLPLPTGEVLVVPLEMRELPTANLHGSTPQVRARPPDGGWAPAADGMALDDGFGVNTLEGASADVLFRDRSRIYLQEHTLVVIYGSAEDSMRQKTEPMRIELDEGELRAGVAALSGRSIDVVTTAGGKVEAESTDTVLRKKRDRTTVSVFDGRAAVTNAGRRVEVPQKFGTSFEQAEPPTPPRPLPAAPAWEGEQRSVLLVGNSGMVRRSWSEVPTAVSYRVEVALDSAFTRVVVRERVPRDVRSLSAEQLPPGVYHVRVRAEDAEDFLGIASNVASVALLQTRVELGQSDGQHLRVSPYGAVEFGPQDELVVSTNGVDFHPLPRRIDFRVTTPEQIVLRNARTSQTTFVDVQYQVPDVTLRAERAGPRVLVQLDGEDIASLLPRADFRIAITQGEERKFATSTASGEHRIVAVGDIDPEKPTTVALLDHRGSTLGEVDLSAEHTTEPPVVERSIELGVARNVVPTDPELSFEWWAAGPEPRASFGTVVATGRGAQLSAAGLARWHDLALSLWIGSNTVLEDARSEAGFIGHAQYGFWLDSLRWDVRGGIIGQATTAGPPTRISFGSALGGELADPAWTWLSNLDFRSVVDDDRIGISPWQLRAAQGAAYRLSPMLRPYAVVEGHWLNDPGRARAALEAGLEFGSLVSGTFGVRYGPFDDAAKISVGAGISLNGR